MTTMIESKEKPLTCPKCDAPLSENDVPHSFSWGEVRLCGPCAHQTYQDLANTIRDDLGMDFDDPVTLG